MNTKFCTDWMCLWCSKSFEIKFWCIWSPLIKHTLGFWTTYYAEKNICQFFFRSVFIWTVSPNLSNVPFPRFQLQPTSSCSPWRSLRLTRAFDCGGFSAKTYCDEVFDKIFHSLIFVRTGKDSLEKWLKLWITSNHFGLTWGPRSKLALFLTSSSRVAKYFSRCF